MLWLVFIFFEPGPFGELSSLLRYVDGGYEDPTTFDGLRRGLGASERPLHYLAVPPSLFSTVVAQLSHSGCARGGRVVVEKPLGRNLASAWALNRALLAVFPEDAVFRSDHYLGKEPAQNLLYFRFSNSLFEPIWNRNFIARIQITTAEELGADGRGHLYEETGAIRDVVQNHRLPAPWYVVPAESKKNSRLIVPHVVLSTMQELGMSYHKVGEARLAELQEIREEL